MFPPKEEDEAMGAEGEVLDEMLELARGGMARDMAKRHGKPIPGEEPMPEEAGAAMEAIPGVEAEGAEEGADPLSPVGEESGELTPEQLKQLLASLGG